MIECSHCARPRREKATSRRGAHTHLAPRTGAPDTLEQQMLTAAKSIHWSIYERGKEGVREGRKEKMNGMREKTRDNSIIEERKEREKRRRA